MEREFVIFKRKVEKWMDRRNVVPSHPWLTTSLAAFLAIPGLRGFWPMSSFDSNGAAYDLSGQGRTLTNTGQAEYDYNSLAPIASCDGTNDYFTRADEAGLDILGNESYVAAGARGLSIGLWAIFNALSPASIKGVIGKWNATTNNRSYNINIQVGASVVRFSTSNNGVAVSSVDSTLTLSTGVPYFIVARFDPGSDMSITVNGTQNEDTLGSAPATLFNSNAAFNIMAQNNGAAANRARGDASFGFLSAEYISDDIVNTLYETSRGIFGV